MITHTRDQFCLTREATTANHVDCFSSGLLCRGSCMLFLLGSVLHRAGAGWHGNAIKKRRFASRAQTLNAHCFVRFASFAAFKNRLQYTARRTNSHSIRPNGRDVRAVACCKIQLENHRQLGIKKKKKTNAKWWHQR